MNADERSCDQSLRQSDGTAALQTIHTHLEAWGWRHRLIEPVAYSPAAALEHVHPDPPLEMRYGALPHEGFWKAWRQSRPTVRLARLIGRTAIAVHGRREEEDGALARCVVERNFHGRMAVSNRQVEGTSERRRIDSEASFHRVALWEFAFAWGKPLNHALRMASRVGGRDPLSARDRLILKMTGRGLDPQDILALRIEALDVNRSNRLYGFSGGKDPFLYRMHTDDEADLWTLIRSNDTLEGHLSSPIERGEPYGRRALSEAEFEGLLAARSAIATAGDKVASLPA